MKRILSIVSLSALLFSCNNNNNPTEQTNEAKTAQDTKPSEAGAANDPLKANPDYVKGLELVATSDCLTCHRVADLNVGPAYRDIANKYEANAKNISLLAEKIIKGGSGVWGQVPMTPHTNLSKKEAEQMVKYIMLLKSRS